MGGKKGGQPCRPAGCERGIEMVECAVLGGIHAELWVSTVLAPKPPTAPVWCKPAQSPCRELGESVSFAPQVRFRAVSEER